MFLFHDLWWTTWVYDLWAHGSYSYTLSLFKIYTLEPKTCMWFIDDNMVCKNLHIQDMGMASTHNSNISNIYIYMPYGYWIVTN